MEFVQPDIELENDDVDISHQVPSEIWVKIISQLNQKELVRARTVCSTWRNVVDEHFQFSVIIHDDKTDLERMYRLRIKDCLVTKLLDDVKILQYPELLRRVRFWGPINILNIHRILAEATKLEELSMTRCAITQEGLFPKDNVLVLEKLIKLELLGYCCKDAGEAVSTNVVRLFSNNMPVLRKIFVNITCHWRQMDPIVASFFGFLAMHRKKITHVNASLIPAAGGHENFSQIHTHIPQNILDLVYDKELQVESLRLTLASKYVSSWAPIISSQKKLTDLRIHWSTSSEPPLQTVSGISASIIYPAIVQSAVNLVQVDLRDLNLTTDERRALVPFDAGIFRFAHSLKRLALVRNKDDCHRLTAPYGAPTLINLDAISTTLEELEIVRFKCKSSEIQILVDCALSLKSVKLQHTGTSNGKGVHGGIVDSIAKKTKIKIMNICPINYHDPEENKRLEALKSTYEGICSGSEHVYYDFDRFRQGIPQPSKRLPLPVQEPVASTSTASTRFRCDVDERRRLYYNLRVRSRLTMLSAMRDRPLSPFQPSAIFMSRRGRVREELDSRGGHSSRLNVRSISAGPSDRRRSPHEVNDLASFQNLLSQQRRCSSAEDLIQMQGAHIVLEDEEDSD